MNLAQFFAFILFFVASIEAAPALSNNLSTHQAATPPQIAAQSLSIQEGPAAGDVVGAITASDDQGITNYRVTQAVVRQSGIDHPNNAVIDAATLFQLNPTSGILTVNDPTHVLSVVGPVVLSVEVTDTEGLTATADVTVMIEDRRVTTATTEMVEWGFGEPYPVIAEGLGVSEGQGIAVNNKVYVFGGFKEDFSNTELSYAYDAATNTWSAIAPLPVWDFNTSTTRGGVNGAGIATDGTNIYLVGGAGTPSSGRGQIFGSQYAYRYIIAEDRYERLPDLPERRLSGGLAFIDNKLYYVSGSGASQAFDGANLYVLDLANPGAGWQEGAPLPNPRTHQGVAAVEGMLYVLGGQHGHDSDTVTQDDVHRYDPATNTWAYVTDLPDIEEAPADYIPGKSHISSGTFAQDGRIFIIGGEYSHGGPYSTAVLAYEPASNQWIRYTDLPQRVASGVGGMVNGNLIYTTGLFRRTTFLGSSGAVAEQPVIRSSTPANGDTDVDPNLVSIVVNDIVFPAGDGNQLDPATLNNSTIKLYQIGEEGEVIMEIPGTTGEVSGGGDTFSFIPTGSLSPVTQYRFEVTDGVKLINGTAFVPYEATFTTGNDVTVPLPATLVGVSFNRVENIAADNSILDRFSSLVIGPDGKLYGSTIFGQIKRWTMAADGTLTNAEVFSPVLTSSRLDGTNGQPEARAIIGLTFDPQSTANNLIAYISHSKLIDFEQPSDDPLDWDGKITRLTGPTLEQVQDVVVHLPRSLKDHLTNSLAFDPVNPQVLYISQGSNTGGGEYDFTWKKDERLLAGAILRLDIAKLGALPLDALTTDDINVIANAPAGVATMSDGTYNPYATTSPLTIYASGIRNAYDLVWHSDGRLYVPANGTAGGSVTPASEDYLGVRRIDGSLYTNAQYPNVPGTSGNENQKDWLLDVVDGGYYGHPNPYRGEFVMNHGGTTYSGLPGQTEPHIDVKNYPDFVLPDPNYREPDYDFGFNKSPNGVIEYRSNAFRGALRGYLLVARFANGDDIMLIEPGSDTRPTTAYANVPGLTDLDDPLDIVEDPATGNLYVSEYDRLGNGVARLTLLRATDAATAAARVELSADELIFEASVGEAGGTPATDVNTLTISNTGSAPLSISSVTLESATNEFTLAGAGPATLAPGGQATYTLTYAPQDDRQNIGYNEGLLLIATDVGTDTVGLYALKKPGTQGNTEVPLQAVVRALGIGIDVGWNSLNSSVTVPLQGEEVTASLFTKASGGPVVIEPVGRYSPAELLPFGWYTRSSTDTTYAQVGVLADLLVNAQTLYPPLASGTTTFDPKGSVFGLYVESRVFGRFGYTEDELNTGISHRTRIYPYKDRAGNLIPNTYLVCFEDADNGDYQDYMFRLSNVRLYDANALRLTFQPAEVSFLVEDSPEQTKAIILSANGAVTGSAISLTSSKPWLTLPDAVVLNGENPISINATDLPVGTRDTAVVVAQAAGYTSDTLLVTLSVPGSITWRYQINFQDGTLISPAGYIDDTGMPYGEKTAGNTTLTYGWVATGTTRPINAQRNFLTRDNPEATSLLNSLVMLNSNGRQNKDAFPPSDWVIDLPNGQYLVNVGVGDPSSITRLHAIEANGTSVIEYDRRTGGGSRWEQKTEEVTVTNGKLRIQEAENGLMTGLQFIRIAPLDASRLQPTVTVTLKGDRVEDNIFTSPVAIGINAVDNSGSQGIASLTYQLNGAAEQSYQDTIRVSAIGSYTLVVRTRDRSGNLTIQTTNFSIREASGALLSFDNLTNVPGTDQSFPANDFLAFNVNEDPIDPISGAGTITHANNYVRIYNEGTNTLVVSDLVFSEPSRYEYRVPASNPRFPKSILPGESLDVELKFIRNSENRKGIYLDTAYIISNADNGTAKLALSGTYMKKPDGNNEVTSQQLMQALGFATTMNGQPYPGSDRPSAEAINSGAEGDLIFSPTFVQADLSQPVSAFQVVALHSLAPATVKLVEPNSNAVVSGMTFTHDQAYHQSLFPILNGTPKFDREPQISGKTVDQLSGPFRVVIDNYYSSGGGTNEFEADSLLGIRVYKAVGQDGEIIPNAYFVLHDYVKQGCGTASANCDWNDNIVYMTNVRPEAVPTAVAATSDLTVLSNTPFTYDLTAAFDRGYPGNVLTYTVTATDGTPLPNWVKINEETGTLSGVPPTADESLSIKVTATDANGLAAESTLALEVIERPTGVAIPLEAECATLNSIWTIGNSDQASNGAYVAIPQGSGDNYQTPSPETEGQLVYTVTLAQAGEYYLYARARAATDIDDSFWIRINGGPWTRWNGFSEEQGFFWKAFPNLVGFLAGENTIEIANREDGLQLDKLLVQSEDDFPTGVGEVIACDGTRPPQPPEPPLPPEPPKPPVPAGDAPVAVVLASPSEGVAPLLVEFDASGSYDDNAIVEYQWTLDTLSFNSDKNKVVYTFADTGTYVVQLTVVDAEQNTGDTTITIQVNESLITGTPDEPASKIVLYPNPVANTLTAQFEGYVGQEVMLTLTTVEGKVMQQVTHRLSKQPIEVDTQNLAAGTYLVRIQTPDQVVVRKIVKE